MNKKLPIYLIVIIIFIAILIASSAVIFSYLKFSRPAVTPSPAISKSAPIPSPEPTAPTTTLTGCGQNRPTNLPLNKEINRGNTDKKQIALTFDAGAGATQTPQILDILKQNNLRVTFFLTGKWAETNPALVKRMVEESHTLGNHTYSHPRLTEISDEAIRQEFARTEGIFQSIDSCAFGKPYFRPPYGSRNQHVLDVAASTGYQSIYWTVDALDWQEDATPEMVKTRIYDNAQNGTIVLMHVGDDITPQVLPEIIRELQSRGFELVNLEEVVK